MKKEELKGAVITALGETVTIERVIYQFKERDGWDIEFVDTKGNYRHWKQWDDGGTIKIKKRLVNYYGSDCTDLFKKYGYDV